MVGLLWWTACDGGGIRFEGFTSHPVVEILAPADGAIAYELDEIELQGTVTGSGPPFKLLRWSSDVDGVLAEDFPLGAGGTTTVRTSLSPGTHHLQLMAEAGKERGVRTVEITVEREDDCTLQAPEQPFELVAGPTSHVAASAGADGVWTAWSQDGSVWAQHLRCDGAVDAGPFALDEDETEQTEPSVAVREGRVMVAWRAGSDVRWRSLARSGPEGEVQTLPGSSSPALVSTQSGWQLAVTRGSVVGWLPLKDSGLPAGELVAQGVGASPALAVDALGHVTLLFERDDELVGHFDGDPSWTARGRAPALAVDLGVRWFSWLDPDDVSWLQRFGSVPARLGPGGPGAIAGDRDGGHLAWRVGEGELAHRVVARFDEHGELVAQLALGATTQEPGELGFARLSARLVFVAWSEGQRAMGVFVRI